MEPVQPEGTAEASALVVVTIASKVDFDAQTIEKDGKTRFTNAAYERQGALWKACFRAGKAPTEAGVALAKAWLAEL